MDLNKSITDSTEANSLEESTCTMLDVLEQQKELEDEYVAVLGASDEKCCTYSQGAVNRQAIYSCLTCCPQSRNDIEKSAGICLACSYRCHENHELVELYTKRNFRCDCPTERVGKICRLNGTLELPQPRNADNVYNQNFQSLYCICHRPYPDPDRTTEEVMLQCAVCEDWFHLQHLDVPPQAATLVDASSEIICGSCMERHAFLRNYTGLALKALESLDETVDNITAAGDTSICEEGDKDKDKETTSAQALQAGNSAAAAGDDEVEEEPECKRQKLESDEKKPNELTTQCRMPTTVTDYEKGATFWGSDWRAALCRCSKCLDMYKQQHVEFLLDAEDSAKSYEERGIKRAASESSTYEEGIRALASIGRVQQIDAISEYNRMRDKLKEYLQTFAVSKKVVTEEDINRFFQEMRNEKNQSVGQPHFCR